MTTIKKIGNPFSRSSNKDTSIGNHPKSKLLVQLCVLIVFVLLLGSFLKSGNMELEETASSYTAKSEASKLLRHRLGENRKVDDDNDRDDKRDDDLDDKLHDDFDDTNEAEKDDKDEAGHDDGVYENHHDEDDKNNAPLGIDDYMSLLNNPDADDDYLLLMKNGLNRNIEQNQGEDIDNDSKLKTLQIVTPIGNIYIHLKPEFSNESVQYIHKLLLSPHSCDSCKFYRSERTGILQGIMTKEGIPENKILGNCPQKFKNAPAHECPDHDPNCGCHGPIMTKGMVAWAAGLGGPDFFINMYDRPAEWWHNEHTVFGQIIDDGQSFDVIHSIMNGSVKKRGGLSMLVKPVNFDLKGQA
mmetsp:Transcript_3465/g.4826  ORF Transcript_3465/g.4826 Transcript_3465/m.4826 type:complete len:356 (-) Transcript_3465:169-1236(-)